MTTMLSNKTISLIKSIIEVGKPFGIEMFIIDNTGMRGKSEGTNVFFIKNESYDFLEFDSLCINKTQELIKRLNFIDNVGNGDFNIEIVSEKESDSGIKFPTRLRIISSSTAVDIGCYHPGKRDIPRMITDEKMVEIPIENNNFETICGMPRVIHNKNKLLNIRTVDGIIVFSVEDNQGDNVTHVITNPPKFFANKKEFFFSYNSNNILPLFKGDKDIVLEITNNGILIANLGMDVAVFPEKSR